MSDINELQPLLIEIGVEEIPAGVAPRMGEALKEAVATLLADANVASEEIRLGVTPRRLLLHAVTCPVIQADREETLWGPPERVAFPDGKPSGAAFGFAKKSGLPLDAFELADKGDGKGLYMKAMRTVTGRAVANIIAEAMPSILRKLPSPKQMQWQDGETRSDAFIRPIRWMVARLGESVIDFSFAGVTTGRISRGHRVHGSSGEINVADPFGWLENQYVIADRDQRKTIILKQLEIVQSDQNVVHILDNELLEEVTDLVEWPQVIAGRYHKNYLMLPKEVSRIELKHHQRCFASKDPNGDVSNVFFTVANIASTNPAAVALGNERVVNARLADAAFYYDRDPRQSLEARVEKLSEVIFQEGLGMVGDQVRRLRGFVLDNAMALAVDANDAQRAAYLCKSDLTTGLVGEFPELQGYMGGIYADKDGEKDTVSWAIREHYMPAGAHDQLPDCPTARAIGIAERADKLLGYFHLGRIPTASADPFALRRSAIGLIRLLEGENFPVSMTLSQVLTEAAKQWNQQRITIAISEETITLVRDFVRDRFMGMSDHFRVSRNALDAALHSGVDCPLDRQVTVARLLTDFANSEAGQAVAAANKRIANILKKTAVVSTKVDTTIFLETAEQTLFTALESAEKNMPSDPKGMLEVLASLRQPVDSFFDDVMVMADDQQVRGNRLALLARLRQLFLNLADVSRL